VLGFPLSRICWEGPRETLNVTLYSQPALLTHSIALWNVLKEHIPDHAIVCMAGHSLGEISALVAAGALDFETALRLILERSQAMHDSAQQTQGGMAAVLGLELQTVEGICKDTRDRGGKVWIAIDNCPGQIVISGESAAIVEASQELKAAGARKIIPLKVSIPAHTPLMGQAEERFRLALAQAEIQTTRIPVLGNVHVKILATTQDIRADLHAQLRSTVRWRESMVRISAMGVQQYLEVGTGSVLCGLQRRILPHARCSSIDQPRAIKDLPAFLSKVDAEGD
jgi:[acyl-carrier-protein] S-malonyltransferase